jgi:D-alanyl-D-alanine carboxypeptidase
MGAVNSRFGTASGIMGDESTAYDIALIFSRMSQDFPELYRAYFTPPQVELPTGVMPNCRLCEGGPADAGIGATGQKTGTRSVAGSSIVVQVENGGRRYVIVTMGTPSSSARIERAVSIAQAVWRSAPPQVLQGAETVMAASSATQYGYSYTAPVATAWQPGGPTRF